MKTIALLSAIALSTGVVMAPAVSYAAHAGSPYNNVDKKTDQGNDTGDSKVGDLNNSQLNQNYQGQNPGDHSGSGQPSSSSFISSSN